MNRTHQCEVIDDLNSAEGFRISIGLGDKDVSVPQMKPTWQLKYESLATIDEVKFGEGTRVGDVISTVELAIDFCPFCGSCLKHLEE